MSLISIENLSFAYDDMNGKLFDNVSFKLDTNYKIGLVGRNGTGKTTFLRLLKRELPFKGQIRSKVSFDYFPLPIADKRKAMAVIIAQIDPELSEWQIIKEMNGLKIAIDCLYQPYDTLSKGEQVKLMLAVLFARENHFLLIDEPTDHLDLIGRRVVADYLSKKKGFIVVSHDRRFLDGCVDHIMAINPSGIEIVSGNYSSWRYDKDLRNANEINENNRLKKEISRLKTTTLQKAEWSDRIEATKIGNGPCDRGYIGHKAAKMMKRAKNIQKRLDRTIAQKESLLKDVEASEKLKIGSLVYNKKQYFYMQDLTFGYDGKTVIREIDLTLMSGDRLAILGSNGSGKTSLIRLIMGDERIIWQGTFVKSDDLIISYVSQDTGYLKGYLNAFIHEHVADETKFKTILRKLGFERDDFDKDIAKFSEGQKKKVLIAKSLSEHAHLYIWDEPLNYLDIAARDQIEHLIQESEATMIMVEHDSYFIEKTANKYLDLKRYN